MKAKIQNGIITDIRFDAEAAEGYVSVPDWVRIGDEVSGNTYLRNGTQIHAPVPDEVTLWAFRASLVLGGITQSQVDTLIAGLDEPAKTVATTQWNYGNYIERGHTLIGQLGAQLGLSTEQIDNVFRTAATLK